MPHRTKVKISLQPEDRWTHRCTLSSPCRALKVRKGGFLLYKFFHQAGMLLKGSHRHWCHHCHPERSREEERRFAVSCLLPVCTSLSAYDNFPAEPTLTGQQGRGPSSLSQIMRLRVTS